MSNKKTHGNEMNQNLKISLISGIFWTALMLVFSCLFFRERPLAANIFGFSVGGAFYTGFLYWWLQRVMKKKKN